MGGAVGTIPRGRISPFDAPKRVCGAAVRGFLSRPTTEQLLGHFEQHLAADPGGCSLIIDVLGIDGFEPGVPARIIYWLAAHAAEVPLAVLVTTSSVLIATVRAGGLLLRSNTYDSVATRGDAVSLTAQRMAGQTRRTVTGERTRASIAIGLPRVGSGTKTSA